MIGQRLGGRGMEVVYKTIDSHLDRAAAIKVLRQVPGADLAEQKLRFEREAKAASV